MLLAHDPSLAITPLYRHMLYDAGAIAERGPYQFAVVMAHAACDLATEAAVSQLLGARHADDDLKEYILGTLTKGFALDNGRARQLYGRLSGDYPAGHKEIGCIRAAWWDKWETSRTLRHHIVHGGQSATSDQAKESVAAATDYVIHIANVVQAKTGRVLWL
jgi:hypothetical protein